MKKLCVTIFICATMLRSISQMPSLIKEITPGTNTGASGWIWPSRMPLCSGRILFWANDGVHGTELWATDGTAQGTYLVKDLVPGSESPFVSYFFKENNTGVYFSIGQGYKEIWFSDGTVENTKLLMKENDFTRFNLNNPGAEPLVGNNSCVVFNDLFIKGVIYAQSTSRWAPCIYKVRPDFDVEDENPLYYGNTSPSFQIHGICEYKNNLILSANESSGPGLYVLAGGGTFVSPIFGTSGPALKMRNVNNNFLVFDYYSSSGSFLAKLEDISNFSPTILANNEGFGNFNWAENLVEGGPIVNNKLYLKTVNGVWATDGTENGTRRAAFNGNAIYLGQQDNKALFYVHNYNGGGSGKTIMWDGTSETVQEHPFEGEGLGKVFSAVGRHFMAGQGLLFYNIDNQQTYTLFGGSSGMNFSFDQGIEGSNLLGDKFITIGSNNSTQLGYEPQKFLMSIKIWTGDISTDWHNPSNWNPTGVPSCTEDILIPSTAGNYPVINANASCKSLFINFGSVTVNTGFKLNYYGELSNFGILNGTVEAGVLTIYYADADEDGFGNPANSLQRCIAPSGHVTNNTDCDDTKKLYLDTDGDTYGSTTLVACGGAVNNTDCNDNNANINPGRTEVCGNNIDDNCNIQVDEGCTSTPTININDIAVYESQGLAVLTISLSSTTDLAVKVRYETADGTAVSKGRNKDFVADRGVLTIPAGSLTGSISISLFQDNLSEGGEYFDVILSRPVNGTIADNAGRVTILDGTAPTTRNTNINHDETHNEALCLSISTSPNPSSSFFNVTIQSPDLKERIQLKVININGQLVEAKYISPGQSLRIGDNYSPGIYVIQVVQGNQRRTIKLIKLSD